jgi:alpha-ketoglutarate-dependent taurine dioxygenase
MMNNANNEYFTDLNKKPILIDTILPSADFPDLSAILSKGNQFADMLHQKGILLFRDFSINTSNDFKEFANLFINDFMDSNGEHIPLEEIKGVFTPVSYSEEEKLLWHNENSFNMSWPLIIIFGAATPAAKGGETPVVDSRVVLANIDKDIIAEFSQKGVMYVRSHGFGFGRSWQQVYQTDDKHVLEDKLKKNNIDYEWYGSNKLITRQVRPSIVKHPITAELSWFNQAQHWHPYCLQPEVREYLLQNFRENELPRNCYFGDGTKIPNEIMQHILDVYQKFEISFQWQKGDVMVLDNVLFGHARNPYEGERKLFVTMGKQASYVNKTSSESRLGVLSSY